MKAGTAATYVTGFIGAVATIAAAFIGVSSGKSIAQNNIEQQIINELGDNGNVTINDISELLEEYENLKTENESIILQNKTYFDELQSKSEELTSLNSQVDEIPDLQFKDLALCIDSEDIPINRQQSMVIINGREYLSKELAEKFFTEDKVLTVKDGTLFVGKVIADKANLFGKNIMAKDDISTEFNGKDSYGNTRTNSVTCQSYNGYIIYTLDQKYSYLKCKISISEYFSSEKSVTLSVKADDNIIYTIDLNKKTEPYDIEIPINNCKLLTFECISQSNSSSCIISDAVVYN